MELNMRGLHTTVRAIRRRVFTEVAKLGFKADADTLLDDMESIPYEIVNDDTEKYRESTYRSRAIVRERLRLAMGLSCARRTSRSILPREWRRAISRRNIMSRR